MSTHTHTTCHHNLLTHNLLTHNLLAHNFSTHNLSTHNFSTHNLLTHNLLPYNFSTHTTSRHITYSHITHKLSTHNFWRGRRGDICLHFAWQAWHLATWTSTLCDRCDTYGIWWRAWFPVDAAVAAPVCVASVALSDICLHFTWQAWRLATWTLTLSVAGATIMASGGALGSQRTPRSPLHLATSVFTLRGRRGTWRRGLPLCLAGVTNTQSYGALGSQSVAAPVCAAGVALGDICLHFAWQVWQLRHLVVLLVPSGRRSRRACLRGKRGAWRHLPSSCVAGVALGGAGVALGDICPHLAWQAWHLATWTSTLRGRCENYGIWWRAWFPVKS